MNYYIQGSAARAEEIKAAFKKLGYDARDFDYSCGLFATFNNDRDVHFLVSNSPFVGIIKTHPDYKELELPVKPNFKVGDWVVIDNCHNSVYQVDSVREYDYMLKHTHGGLMPFPFSSETRLSLWTIADAKDGDVLVTTKIGSCPFIYRKTGKKNNFAYYYAGIDGDGDFTEGCLKRTLFHFGLVSSVIPATKEQRDLLFAKIKEAGYQWDADKKELRKIKPHYDIANFHAGMPVLVRDNNKEWRYVLFSHITNGSWIFNAVGTIWQQCIPFEGNEHLLGTTDMPDEMYINW